MFSLNSIFLFTYLSIGSSALAIILLIFVTIRHHLAGKHHSMVLNEPPEFVATSGIGKLEIGAEGLREIVIICHKIEKPTNELLAAVRYNLANGRSYKFFVSKSNYNTESNAYFKIFKAIADVEGNKVRYGTTSISDLVKLQPLPFDWHDNPPLFCIELEVLTLQEQLLTEGIPQGKV